MGALDEWSPKCAHPLSHSVHPPDHVLYSKTTILIHYGLEAGSMVLELDHVDLNNKSTT